LTKVSSFFCFLRSLAYYFLYLRKSSNLAFSFFFIYLLASAIFNLRASFSAFYFFLRSSALAIILEIEGFTCATGLGLGAGSL